MGLHLSGKAFARLDGSTPITVRRARQAGHLVADSNGRLDPKHPTNAQWLQRAKQPDQRNAIAPEARLAAASAKLHTLEFEVAVRREFYVPREPLAARLHLQANALLTALTAFPEPWAFPMLWPVEEEREAFAVSAREAMARHIGEIFSDIHGAIERALDTAGTQWRGHKPEPRKGIALPPWEAPVTRAQAERRRAAAVTELEAMKVAVRRGELLADWPARRAANGLVIDWQQQCMEWFAVRQGPNLLTRMHRGITHSEQWALFKALQGVMRTLLGNVDRAVAAADTLAPSSSPCLGRTVP